MDPHGRDYSEFCRRISVKTQECLTWKIGEWGEAVDGVSRKGLKGCGAGDSAGGGGRVTSIQCSINKAWPCARGCAFTSSDPTDGECPSACWGQGVPDSHLQS